MASTSHLAGRIRNAASSFTSDNQQLIAVTNSLHFLFRLSSSITQYPKHPISRLILFDLKNGILTSGVPLIECFFLASGRTTPFQGFRAEISDIRKAVGWMKELAVDLEKDNLFDKVKELEDAVVELVSTFEDSAHLSSAVQSVANRYQPGEELTNFNKLVEEEVSNLKKNSTSDPKKHPLVRQFKEAVWNVHHEGQPMPGDEQEEIVMTSTQTNILNITCPLTGKPVTELAEPVRSMECRHIYEKKTIMQYIMTKHIQCPISGCPRTLKADKVVCDPLLLIEIDELRKMNRETNVIEDFTMLNEDE